MKKAILIGLGIAVVGGAAWIGYKWYKKSAIHQTADDGKKGNATDSTQTIDLGGKAGKINVGSAKDAGSKLNKLAKG